MTRDNLLTYKDLAAATGHNIGTIRQWAVRGKLPKPDHRFGQSPAWRPDTIEAWIQAHKRA